jgi:hypothetical protein
MSLMNARMAKRTQFRTFLTRSSCFAGIGIAFSSCWLEAQENVFRPASIQLPAVTAVPVGSTKTIADYAAANKLKDNSSKTLDSEKASNSKDDSAQVGESKPKNREPIVLPNLSVPNTSIQGVGTGATPEDVVAGRLPPRIPMPYGADRYGFWALDTKTWTAPVFCHQPLYFEDVMLERHGQERFPCAQPLVSGARFFSNVALLPYKSYLQRPLDDRYSTGYYRPGSAVPCVRQRAPYDAGAMRFQLLTTGTAVLAGQP